MSQRDLFSRIPLQQIPKLLTLQDRNRHSATYGCFDRNYWHYKIIDFPSGMAQEFVWPLALAYNTNAPGNDWYQEPSLLELAMAGMHFAARSAHADGSCDDYYPYERASGAAAFSLLAFLESYTLLKLHDESLLSFFERRADWLASHQESGRLSNHQALIVLCLELIGRLSNDSRWNRQKEERLDLLLSWQDEEGWFQEYEGFDPGYHTLTISLLARIFEIAPSERLRAALEKAILLAREFVHPDGSFGGEYGSRNTYNFFPHGFELAGKWFPAALSINDSFLSALERDLKPCYEDDHIIGHHLWNYLLAWRDFVEQRPETESRKAGRVVLPNAGLIVDRRQNQELYLAANKGGVFKLFSNGKLIASDTQFSLLFRDGNKNGNAVGHMIQPYILEQNENEIAISAELHWASTPRMTTMKLLVLRVVMITAGRFMPNVIRKMLQRMLITGKNRTAMQLQRKFQWMDDRWTVIDEIRGADWGRVAEAKIGCDQTSIYVVMSRTFQKGQLLPWIDVTPEVRKLKSGEPLRIVRSFEP